MREKSPKWRRRYLMDAAIQEIHRQLLYKMRVIKAPRFYPSSKTCHKCGHTNQTNEDEVDEYSRTLGNARKQGSGLRFSKVAVKNAPARFRPYNREMVDETNQEITERCWKGYTQKGMKTMFGKRYPNCVKKTK
jgi:hypothetical protein